MSDIVERLKDAFDHNAVCHCGSGIGGCDNHDFCWMPDDDTQMLSDAKHEIERLRVIAKNAAVLLEWLSAERSAHACDDREAIEVIRPKIVEARRTLSLSIQDAHRHCANIPTAAEWENWRG